MEQLISDPETVEWIEVAFLLALYQAEVLFRRRMQGLARPPRRRGQLPPRLAEAVARARRAR